MQRDELEALWRDKRVGNPGHVTGTLSEEHALRCCRLHSTVTSIATGERWQIVQPLDVHGAKDGPRVFQLVVDDGDEDEDEDAPRRGANPDAYVFTRGRQLKGPEVQGVIWPDPPLPTPRKKRARLSLADQNK